MSHKRRKSASAERQARAHVFAALGDETRLSLVAALCGGKPRSIAQLTQGSKLTRQAISKHLLVLARAGVVHGIRMGRECHFEFDLQPIEEVKKYLDFVSEEWDQTLSRLKSFVEE